MASDPLGLPGESGFDVAARLRADPGSAAAILVALTGWGTEEDRRRTRAAGFDHHLVKPADAAAVAAVLGPPADDGTPPREQAHRPRRQ